MLGALPQDRNQVNSNAKEDMIRINQVSKCSSALLVRLLPLLSLELRIDVGLFCNNHWLRCYDKNISLECFRRNDRLSSNHVSPRKH